MDATKTMANGSYEMELRLSGDEVRLKLTDRAAGFAPADGPVRYRASRPCDEGSILSHGLRSVSVRSSGDTLELRGELAGLSVTHTFRLPADRPILEERLRLSNGSGRTVELEDLSVALSRELTDHLGVVLPDLAGDRIVAIPLRHRPTDPADFDLDFAFADLLRRSGREHRVNVEPLSWPQYGHFPAPHWASEAWGWRHGEHTLCVGKLNQDGMEYGLISAEPHGQRVLLCLGGSGMHAGDPSSLCRIDPGGAVTLGLTRYETVRGGDREAAYAYRRFLDESGCRFPHGYDPPVHWNELYDNPEWNLATPGDPPNRVTRPTTYTKELLELEARKAREYGCEALYLDPGWDTAFGTLEWAERWLGPRKDFVELMRRRHGLGVSLHCPLANWMSVDGRGVQSWPREAFRARADGSIVDGAVCMGARQYLEEAERRLLGHCADGVVFLMFDGNWWNGGCWNPAHGHPIPFTKEDYVRANLDLARRIHTRYPEVLIEMHDMITGGTYPRYTPVYYKYGLPGSYDENWGFELMWQPMEDIRAGRARSLYYYNLGCNVPLYLHVDLRDDNEHCLVLWWYASTCRHLGIGGTHPTPAIAEAQRRAMCRYGGLARFFKRGEFYGMHEEAHVHALPAEGAFVVSLFNLSGTERVVEGRVSMAEMGFEPDRFYVMPKGGRIDRGAGTFVVSRRMPPWSAEVLEVKALGVEGSGVPNRPLEMSTPEALQ